MARIKCPAQVMYAPPHGQARALCCWAPKPGIKHVVRRASACPFRRAGALVGLVLTGKRGVVWLELSASLTSFMRHPTGSLSPSVVRHCSPESSTRCAG